MGSTRIINPITTDYTGGKNTTKGIEQNTDSSYEGLLPGSGRCRQWHKEGINLLVLFLLILLCAIAVVEVAAAARKVFSSSLDHIREICLSACLICRTFNSGDSGQKMGSNGAVEPELWGILSLPNFT